MIVQNLINLYDKSYEEPAGKDAKGNPVTITKFMYFTDAHEPITWGGRQYIPMSTFDLAKHLPPVLENRV